MVPKRLHRGHLPWYCRCTVPQLEQGYMTLPPRLPLPPMASHTTRVLLLLVMWEGLLLLPLPLMLLLPPLDACLVCDRSS